MSAEPPASTLQRLGRRLETGALVVLLCSMIGLAATQIILRNVFESGLVWADPLLRIMVLWLAVIGGLAASRDQRHISIDVLTRFLRPRAAAVVAVIVSLVVAGVCGLVSASSYVMVKEAFDYQDIGLWGQPAWMFQAILPLGFALMTWRYLCHAGRNLLTVFTQGGTQSGDNA